MHGLCLALALGMHALCGLLCKHACEVEKPETCVQVTKGNDVVITIEKAKTDRNDKPFEDIKIVNIEVEKTN